MHAALGAKRIHERIEVERSNSTETEVNTMDRVVRAAETLLRAGMNVSQVSRQTSLSEKQVTSLAENLGLAVALEQSSSPVKRRNQQV